MSLPVISVSLPLNTLVINPPQLSLVCQQPSRYPHNSPRDKKFLDSNHINSNSNELSSPVIPTLPPWNDPFINPTQLSSVCQQSSSSSPNTTHELQAIQENNTTNKFPLRYKGYADMNPCLLSVHDHQVILGIIEARENLNHDEYVEEEDHYNIDSDKSDIDAN